MNQLDATFSVLGDSTRRAILAQLSEGELSLSQLADPYDMSLTAVSKHVRVLEGVGLVSVEKRGRIRHCRLQAEPLMQATNWLDDYRQFWEPRLTSLARHLGEGDGL